LTEKENEEMFFLISIFLFIEEGENYNTEYLFFHLID